MATMKEVAKQAGVSRYTVSKVLNGVHVSEKTRQKVMDACSDLHYSRNIHATNLVRNQSFTIGMIISQNFDSFFGEIINAAEQEAYKHGYQLICQCSHGSLEEEARIIQNFESLRVCGIIVAPVVSENSEEQWSFLEERMPVVYFDCYLKKKSNYIINDNLLSAKLITEHLLSKKRIPAYLGSIHPDTNLAIKMRKKGYIDTLKKNGIEPILIPTNNTTEKVDNQAFGYDNLVAYLKDNQLPEAIFCATDRIAMGAIYALQEKGYTVGKDVLVAGHDDLQFGAFMNPTLTTVTQPKQEMGAECVKTILSLIEDEGGHEKNIHKKLKPELIVRQSTQLG